MLPRRLLLPPVEARVRRGLTRDARKLEAVSLKEPFGPCLLSTETLLITARSYKVRVGFWHLCLTNLPICTEDYCDMCSPILLFLSIQLYFSVFTRLLRELFPTKVSFVKISASFACKKYTRVHLIAASCLSTHLSNEVIMRFLFNAVIAVTRSYKPNLKNNAKHCFLLSIQQSSRQIFIYRKTEVKTHKIAMN